MPQCPSSGMYEIRKTIPYNLISVKLMEIRKTISYNLISVKLMEIRKTIPYNLICVKLMEIGVYFFSIWYCLNLFR